MLRARGAYLWRAMHGRSMGARDMETIDLVIEVSGNRGAADVAKAAGERVLVTVLPIIAVAFILFLVTGIAFPVLPLHVHRGLGLGTFVVGLVAGAQFAAALISRFWSGRHADDRGAKRATVAGLLLATAAGLLYLLSLRFVTTPTLSVAILLLGRAVLGAAESCVVIAGLMIFGREPEASTDAAPAAEVT